VIIYVAISALIICFLYCCRQRRHLLDDDSSTVLNMTNTDTYSSRTNDTNRPETSPNTSSSLSSTQYGETEPSKKPNINFRPMFEDNSF
jgi:hypothetical protein